VATGFFILRSLTTVKFSKNWILPIIVVLLAAIGTTVFVYQNYLVPAGGITTGQFRVTFVQKGEFLADGCNWLVPWAVILNGVTKTQPSNASVSPYHDFQPTLDASFSKIVFLVYPGKYNFTVNPSTVPSTTVPIITPFNGTLDVRNDTVISLTISGGKPC